jgi:hypothetical protein
MPEHMDTSHIILSKKDHFGSLYLCGKGCFHLQVGRMNLALSPDEYMELVDLVDKSAANFELMQEIRRDEAAG